MKKLTTLLTAGILASSWSLVAADANEHSEWDISKLDASKLPPAATAKNLTYAKDIKPMLEESCFRCHGEERQRGELRLDSLEALLKGGENGKIVQAGSSTKSTIVFASAQVNDDIAMPPKRGGRGGPGGRGGRGNFQPPPEVVKRFDKDGDGQLNETERQAMFEEFRAQRGGGPGGPGGRGPGGPGGPGGGRGQGGPGGGGRGPGGGPGGPPAKPLTAEQVGILRAWIDQGAK